MCWLCGGEGTIVTCCDDMCRGLGECIHGDGEAECPECHGGRDCEDCEDCDDDCEYRDVDRDDLGMDPDEGDYPVLDMLADCKWYFAPRWIPAKMRRIEKVRWSDTGAQLRHNQWQREIMRPAHKRNKRRSAMRRQGKGGGR